MLSVYHAIHHTFLGTGAAKIIENHHGRAAIVMVQQMLVTQQQAPNRAAPTWKARASGLGDSASSQPRAPKASRQARKNP
jgi:hypothetical protein